MLNLNELIQGRFYRSAKFSLSLTRFEPFLLIKKVIGSEIPKAIGNITILTKTELLRVNIINEDEFKEV